MKQLFVDGSLNEGAFFVIIFDFCLLIFSEIMVV